MSFKAHSERGILPMKNSDMKIIAIILAIALFFTIITSNAVSIASVVLLATDSTATEDTSADQQGANTNQPAANTNQPAANTNQPAANTNQPAANTNTNTNTNTPAANNNAGTSTDAPAANNNAGGTSTDAPAATGAIDKEALAMFQKAAKDIHENGVAGYRKTNKQEIVEIDVGGNDAIANLIASFLKPGESVNEKGTDDAKNRMPISDCSESYIKSVTKAEQGDNVVITIVMNDQVNPSYDDTDGLVKMTRDFLDMKDVHETVKTNSAVKVLVRELTTGEMNYKAFTIVATMTKDGKFVNIKHSCDADLIADAKLIVGSLKGSGVLRFTAEFSDFKY